VPQIMKISSNCFQLQNKTYSRHFLRHMAEENLEDVFC